MPRLPRGRRWLARFVEMRLPQEFIFEFVERMIFIGNWRLNDILLRFGE